MLTTFALYQELFSGDREVAEFSAIAVYEKVQDLVRFSPSFLDLRQMVVASGVLFGSLLWFWWLLHACLFH